MIEAHDTVTLKGTRRKSNHVAIQCLDLLQTHCGYYYYYHHYFHYYC